MRPPSAAGGVQVGALHRPCTYASLAHVAATQRAAAVQDALSAGAQAGGRARPCTAGGPRPALQPVPACGRGQRTVTARCRSGKGQSQLGAGVAKHSHSRVQEWQRTVTAGCRNVRMRIRAARAPRPPLPAIQAHRRCRCPPGWRAGHRLRRRWSLRRTRAHLPLPSGRPAGAGAHPRSAPAAARLGLWTAGRHRRRGAGGGAGAASRLGWRRQRHCGSCSPGSARLSHTSVRGCRAARRRPAGRKPQPTAVCIGLRHCGDCQATPEVDRVCMDRFS